ncbi:hypothetical protein [Paenibacillus sp. S150]|uniref:hypothetical protein n=1 Tax=Paenibacillus sp. S150 TaxID=2749826 RepID=UPI001C57202B|nr:hypothetical protein [Paenibacillus sp. S150]MBW4081768.1 hypothetical protein [Paenibacillus sp. S150]
MVSLFKEADSPVQTFSMEYPDGSRISSTVENIVEKDSSKIVSVFSPEEIARINSGTNDTSEAPDITTLAMTPYITGPWNSVSLINTEPSILYNNGWPSGQVRQITSKTEWSFSSGASYSKLNDVFQWQWYGVVTGSGESSVYNFSVAPLSDSGAGASYGVVTIASESPNHPRKSGTGTNGKVQGYMDVQYQVSGSFSATWGILSIYVNAGAQWHQYAITEVDGWSYVDHYAGTYK